jgi:hypothetical protein
MDMQNHDQAERRTCERHELPLEITVRAPGGWSKPATLRSLSAGGCTVTGADLSEVGERYWVRLPGLESQLATLDRSEGSRATLIFCNPLHPAVVRSYAERNRPQWDLTALSETRLRQLLEKRAESRQPAPAASPRLEVAGSAARLENLSASGVEVTTPLRLRRGSLVSVKLGAGEPFPARVVRRDGNKVALRLPRFALLLHQAA